MFIRKNLILSSIDYGDKKAVLSLQNDGIETCGKLRLYGFGGEPQGIMSLGFYFDGKVKKAGLTREENMVYAFSFDTFKLPEKFSCAMINFNGGEPKPILFGNSEGYSDRDKVLDNVASMLFGAKNVQDVENILDDNEIDYDEELKSEIEKEIDKCMTASCDKCEGCKYKQYYFANLGEEKKVVEEEKLTFYKEIKNQIDKLFEENPTEEYLQNLLPGSKWAKVSVDNEDNYYVLGLIYEGEILKFICYGVPGVYQKLAPKELSGYPIWFALDQDNPEGFGYWLTYQDAESGESIKAVVE